MHPQFNPDRLAKALEDAGIAYRAFPELGGRRRPRADSTNTYWRNASFRGYADYMKTPEFEAGLARLMQSAGEARTAMMCAEALWWRCHRSLIADALNARGVLVLHIMDHAKTVEHRYTSAARVADGRLHYGPGPICSISAVDVAIAGARRRHCEGRQNLPNFSYAATGSMPPISARRMSLSVATTSSVRAMTSSISARGMITMPSRSPSR